MGKIDLHDKIRSVTHVLISKIYLQFIFTKKEIFQFTLLANKYITFLCLALHSFLSFHCGMYKQLSDEKH